MGKLTLLTVVAVLGQEDPKGQSISFKPPKLSEEEQDSMVLPGHLRCDACRAMAYQMVLGLEKAEQLHSIGGKKPLPEHEVIEALEDTCETKLEGYGLKGVQGVNRLSGPGLPAADVAGMIMGGGKWPARLRSKCESIVGDLGEMTVYKLHRYASDATGFFTKMCIDTTKDCTAAALEEGKSEDQPPVKKSRKSKTSKKKKKKKKKKKESKKAEL